MDSDTRRQGDWMNNWNHILMPAALLLLAGCVKLQAPDKPIEINLNVTIRQEVVIKLEKDVQDLISNNPGLF